MKENYLQAKLNEKQKELNGNTGSAKVLSFSRNYALILSMTCFWVNNIKHDTLVGYATAGTHEYPEKA